MRKLFLFLSIVFVVVCYGFPCLILPFGTYQYETTVAGVTVKTEYKFDFKGKVKIKSAGHEVEMYYKLKGNEIIVSEDNKFDDNDSILKINSIYNVDNAVNVVGHYIAIGVGVMAVCLVATIPSKKKKTD